MTISANLNCSPFEVLDQDVDEVIMLINFYLRLGASKGNAAKPLQKGKKEVRRVRVNDKTATGGWF